MASWLCDTYFQEKLNREFRAVTDPSDRFLMSLEQSVELVEFASNASPGDIFVHKAPSATVQDLPMTHQTHRLIVSNKRLLERVWGL